MNFKGTFIPKKVLGRLGFRIAFNLIRDYVNADVLADMSKLKVSLTHVVMTDIDWCILMSYLISIMEDQQKKHPELKRLVDSGEIPVLSMFTQIVFVSEGGEIMTSAREQGMRLPSYFMQDSRIGLYTITTKREAYDSQYVSFMHGCVLNERLLHDRFDSKEGQSVFLFYDSYSSSMHRKMFLSMTENTNNAVLSMPATQPIIKILSNRYVTPTKSHSKSLACYFCRDSDNLYTVDVDLGNVFEEIFLNTMFVHAKEVIYNMNKLSEVQNFVQSAESILRGIFPNANQETSGFPAPNQLSPVLNYSTSSGMPNNNNSSTSSGTPNKQSSPENENTESESFDAKMPASLKRPINPATIESVQTEPEIVPKKKKKTSSKPATLLENVTPTVLPDVL